MFIFFDNLHAFTVDEIYILLFFEHCYIDNQRFIIIEIIFKKSKLQIKYGCQSKRSCYQIL